MEHSKLGTILASVFNFQFFNHELVAVVHKVEHCDRFELKRQDPDQLKALQVETVVKPMPFVLLDRMNGSRGTCWVIPQADDGTTFCELAVSRVMERFGRNGQFCEFHDFGVLQTKLASVAYIDARVCSFPPSFEPVAHFATSEMAEETLSEYEAIRLERVAAKQLKLRELGLVSIADPQPGSHLDIWRQTQPVSHPAGAPMDMIVMPPLWFDPEAILPGGEWIDAYRGFVVETTKQAISKLKEGSYLVIGARDVRVDKARTMSLAELSSVTESSFIHESGDFPDTRLVPLSLLVLQDARRAAKEAGTRVVLKLREVTVCVPDQHAKRKTSDIDGLKKFQNELEASWLDETVAEESEGAEKGLRRMLPIVHIIFYLFQIIAPEDEDEAKVT